MNKAQALELFRNIAVWKRKSERAPNKPLLLLYAIGQLLKGYSRFSYAVIDQPLKELLREFGPSRNTYHTEYPFWRLQNDKLDGEALWLLSHSAAELKIRNGNTDAKKRSLIENSVSATFSADILTYLTNDKSFRDQVCEVLLGDHFPKTMHEDILSACGLANTTTSAPGERDPNFRKIVLTAYRNRCCICGMGIQLDSSNVALEGAHIKWVQANGPNTVNNGFSMCSLHHKLFDRGAFTVLPDFKINVSERISGPGHDEVITRFESEEIILPSSERYYPAEEFLTWHRNEVFRKAF